MLTLRIDENCVRVPYKHHGYCAAAIGRIATHRNVQLSADGTFNTNVEGLVLWSIGPQGLQVYRQDVHVATSFVVCVLAQAEDTGAINLAMHLFKTEVEAKLQPNVTVAEVLTDITVDGGPADLALDEELPELQIWRDVQHVKKNAKESARGSPTDVKKYTSDLVNVASPMLLCITPRHIYPRVELFMPNRLGGGVGSTGFQEWICIFHCRGYCGPPGCDGVFRTLGALASQTRTGRPSC